MTEREAYIAFNLTDRIGSVTLGGMIAKYGSAVAAWEAYPKKISRAGGPVDWEAEVRLARKYGVVLLTAIDADYPEILRKTTGHPLVLYVKGDVKALSHRAVALVGTRRATNYGLDQANRLAYGLAQADWMVLSGLAVGIDAAAHRGALEAGGLTVGIIGSGLDRFYPEENRTLAREIVQHGGAVISEFPFGRSADTTTFPIRNHVVAALARGLVAIEAPVKSGTLITAGIAADLGRTVMAVPARVDSRMSAGCLNLIRDGAVLVRNVDDVLLELADEPTKAQRKAEAQEQATRVDPETPSYSPEEALFMLHVEEEGTSLDDLITLTGMAPDRINVLAMQLRIKGFIRFLPGNRVSPLTQRQ